MNGVVLGDTSYWHVTFLASFLVWIMFLGIIALWVVDGRVRKQHALHALASAFAAYTASDMIKSIFPTLRPFEVNGMTPLTLTVHGGGAFPSAHAAMAFAIAFSIYLRDKKLGLAFMVSAVLVSLGRVWSNMHYTLDVFAGALIGFTIAYLLEKLNLGKLLRK